MQYTLARRMKLLAIAGAIMAAQGGIALAAETDIHNLPNKGNVTVSGTVEKVKNPHEFTLRDNSGAVNVRLLSSESASMPSKGSQVIVIGQVENRWMGLLGKDIKATSISPAGNGAVGMNPGSASSDNATGNQ